MSLARLLALVPVVLLLTHGVAHAQPTPADRALATDLFQRGRGALLQGAYAEACPLLEESQHLDPAGGTLLNLALCHEQLGRTATAWSEFLEALSVARRDHREDRMRFASEHIAALEQRLSRLVVQIAVDPQTPGLLVERDGTPLARSVWGVAMPVDPGEHTVQVSAPGFRPFLRTVEVKDGSYLVTVTVAELLPDEPTPQASDAQTAPTVEVAQRPVETELKNLKVVPPRLSRVKRGAVGLFVVSMASAVAATVCGVRAIRLENDAESQCSNGRCSDRGRELNHKAGNYADASTWLTVGSAVTGVGGVAMWFVPGSTHPAAPTSAWGIRLHGSF